MASQLTTALIIISGLVILFHISGLIETGSTVNSVLLNLLLDPTNLEDSLKTKIIGGIGVVGILATIFTGIATRNVELTAMQGVTTLILSLMWDIIAVYTVVHSENPALALLFFSPMLLMLPIIAIDFWRRND